MKLSEHLSDLIKSAPSILLLALGVFALFQWVDRTTIDMELEDLTVREIHLRIQNAAGEPLKEASINVLPMYSFDEIKPMHQLTILGEGYARVSIAFVRYFKIKIGANGYRTTTIEYDESDSPEVTVILKPL